MKLKKLQLTNYQDVVTTFPVISKKIKNFMIHVITGDEVAVIEFEDGTFQQIDSGMETRTVDFNDGSYTVPLNCIREWNEILKQLRKQNECDLSYKRQDIMTLRHLLSMI